MFLPQSGGWYAQRSWGHWSKWQLPVSLKCICCRIERQLISRISWKLFLLMQVVARDDDQGSNGQLSYVLSGGNDEGVFSLSSSGQLSLTQTLDRETRGKYILLITASDSGKAEDDWFHPEMLDGWFYSGSFSSHCFIISSLSLNLISLNSRLYHPGADECRCGHAACLYDGCEDLRLCCTSYKDFGKFQGFRLMLTQNNSFDNSLNE